MEIYLDNSATTRAYPEVARLVTKLMLEDYGNPSALHQKGIDAEQYLRQARETMARILKAQEKENRRAQQNEHDEVQGCDIHATSSPTAPGKSLCRSCSGAPLSRRRLYSLGELQPVRV